MALDLDLPAWFSTVAVAAVGAASGFFIALINRGPALETAMNARMESLMEAQDRHIRFLTTEVHALNAKVEALTSALRVRDEHCHACEHWQDLIQPELEKIGGGCRGIGPDPL
jgi:hypothetical protein